MNNLSEKAIISAEVERIAGELMQLGKRDSNGIYWTTPAPVPSGLPGESIDIFNGNAGIILFFLRLYKYYKKPAYLQTAKEAANRLLQHNDVLHPRFYTFYGGAAGILYVCIQLYKTTGNETYLNKALQLEPSYRTGFIDGVTQCDLLSGKAGILLAVSQVYAHTKEPSLLHTIDEILNKLVSGAHIAQKGLKWDTHKHSYDSLTGFSHGASGIAFALLQTGYYFNAPGLQYLAKQALQYEMQYSDDATGNYMDLRVGAERMKTISNQHQQRLHNWPLHLFQPTMTGLSSWAHGAAGCAVSRLFAYELTHEQAYAQQARRALDYSWSYYLRQQQIDYSLCSGYGGIAAVFEQASKILRDPMWHTKALQIAMAAISYHGKQHTYNSKIPKHITDHGLFSGLAGVGYWLLGCLQNFDTDDVLHPALEPSRTPCDRAIRIRENYSIGRVNRNILNRYYPVTIQQIALHDEEQVNKLFDEEELTVDRLDNSIQSYATAGSPMLYATYERERQVAGLWKQHTGFLQYRQRCLLAQALFEQYQQLTYDEWLTLYFKTAEHIVVTEQRNESEQSLYYCHEFGISCVAISGFTAVLLQHFKKCQLVETVAGLIRQQYFIHEQVADVQRAIIGQVKELVAAGFLTPEITSKQKGLYQK